MDKTELSDLGRAAAFYAGEYIPVLPLTPGGETPLTENGCKDASTDEAQIVEWWSKNPTANVGCYPGTTFDEKNYCVFRIESSGKESLQNLQAELGELPQTWTFTNGTGTEFLWFEIPCWYNLKGTESKLAPGVNMIGEDGFSIMPPSVTGTGEYRWTDGNNPDFPDLVSIANLPDKWFDRVQSIDTHRKIDEILQTIDEDIHPCSCGADPNLDVDGNEDGFVKVICPECGLHSIAKGYDQLSGIKTAIRDAVWCWNDDRKKDVKSDFTLFLNVDSECYPQKPQRGSSEPKKIRIRLECCAAQTEITIPELASVIQQGRTFTAAVLNGKTDADWVQQWLCGVDIDNDEKVIGADGKPVKDENGNELKQPIEHPLTIPAAMEICQQYGLKPGIIYHTFSNSDRLEKFRLLFLLDEPLTKADETRSILERLVALFPGSDKGVKDLSRMLYGSTPGSVVLCKDVRNDPDVFRALPPVQVDKPQTVTPSTAAAAPKQKRKRSAAPSSLTDEQVLEKARRAHDGWKFEAVYNGGLLPGATSLCQSALTLCDILAFWTGKNELQIDSIVRSSPLYTALEATENPHEMWQNIGQKTIRKAVEACTEVYTPVMLREEVEISAVNSIEELPTNGKKEPLTIEWTAKYLILTGRGVRYSVIEKCILYDGFDIEESAESLPSNAPVILSSEMRQYFSGANVVNVADFLNVIAQRKSNQYNPVIAKLGRAQWDLQARFPQLFEAMGIKENDKLSQVLVKKWFWQCYALALNDNPNDPYGADGCLALRGEQGIGKTQFVRAICLCDRELFKTGQKLDSWDKDTRRRCCSSWIVELGEVESTFKKADIEDLKAFITESRDEYRLPYGRTDVRVNRRTSLIATCNSEKFLNDTTGSRRFWTVEVHDLKLDILTEEFMLQLWAEVRAVVENDRQCFRLTKEERAQLQQRNSDYQMPVRAQDEVEDIIAKSKRDPGQYETRLCTVSDFRERYSILQRFTTAEIGKALTAAGIPENRTNRGRFRALPIRKSSLDD